MKPTPKTETKPESGKASPESFKPIRKAGEEISSEFKKVEDTIKKLPVNRRTVFFIGFTIVIMAFLGIFGRWVIGILGLLVMYFSFTGKNPLDSENGK